MESYTNAAQLAALARPQVPVFCARPAAAAKAARFFLDGFPGETFYAVKANPRPWLLEALYAAGVRHFETASIEEVRLIAGLFPGATIAFMHPVKSFEAIGEAYRLHGVRVFALDSMGELDKIRRATGEADDLTLCVRCAVANDHARISLAAKFGVSGAAAVALLRAARLVARRLGVAFHVGSQTLSPTAYTAAMSRIEKAIVRAGVIVDVIDVGGGFPSAYPGMAAPPLADYFAAIRRRFERLLVAENCALWCEPGRALSAEASSLIVRVEGRRGDHLYINEGVYGALFDAGHLKWVYPAQALGAPRAPAELAAFSFYGPTCDDLDFMPGPFYLPADVAPGDYVEIGMLGAYGFAMRTAFNGFGSYVEASVEDAPMLTVYAAASPAAPAKEEIGHV